MPTSVPGEPKPTGTPKYILNLTQNPALPVIDVYAKAPTAKQAIALANSAGTGLSAFLAHQAASGAVAPGNRVAVTQLGPATGGIGGPRRRQVDRRNRVCRDLLPSGVDYCCGSREVAARSAKLEAASTAP